MYTVKKGAIFPARESLVSDIPAGDGKMASQPTVNTLDAL
jgi:hypothetical protein